MTDISHEVSYFYIFILQGFHILTLKNLKIQIQIFNILKRVKISSNLAHANQHNTGDL